MTAAWLLIILTAMPTPVPFFTLDACKAAVAAIHDAAPDLRSVCVLRGVGS